MLIGGIVLTIATAIPLAMKIVNKNKKLRNQETAPSASSTNWIENETTPLLLNNNKDE
jgi:hypothetical protein